MSRQATPLRTMFVAAVSLLIAATAVPVTATAGSRASPEIFDLSGDAHAGVAVAQLGVSAFPSDGMWDLTRVYVGSESLDAVFVTVAVKELDDSADVRPEWGSGDAAVAGAVEESSVRHEVFFQRAGQDYTAIITITKYRVNDDDPADRAAALLVQVGQDLRAADALARNLAATASATGPGGVHYAGDEDILVPDPAAQLAGLAQAAGERLNTLDDDVGGITDQLYAQLYAAVDELTAAKDDPAGYTGQKVEAARQALEDNGIPREIDADAGDTVAAALEEWERAKAEAMDAMDGGFPHEELASLGQQVEQYLDAVPNDWESLMAMLEELEGQFAEVRGLIDAHAPPVEQPDVLAALRAAHDDAIAALECAQDPACYQARVEEQLAIVLPLLRDAYSQVPEDPGQEIDEAYDHVWAAQERLQKDATDYVDRNVRPHVTEAQRILTEFLADHDPEGYLPPECRSGSEEITPEISCDAPTLIGIAIRLLQGVRDLLPDTVDQQLVEAERQVLALAECIDNDCFGTSPTSLVPGADALDEHLATVGWTLDTVGQVLPPGAQETWATARASIEGAIALVGGGSDGPLVTVPTGGTDLPVRLPLGGGQAQLRFDGPHAYAAAPNAATIKEVAAQVATAAQAVAQVMDELGVASLAEAADADPLAYAGHAEIAPPTIAYGYAAHLRTPGGQTLPIDAVLDVRADEVTVRLPKDLVGFPKKGDQLTQMWATSWVDQARMDIAPAPSNAGADADAGQAAGQGMLVTPTFGRAYAFVHESFAGTAAARATARILGHEAASVEQGDAAVYTVRFANPGTTTIRGVVTLNAPAPGWTHQVSHAHVQLPAGASAVVAVTVARIGEGPSDQVTTVTFTPEGGQAQQVSFTTSSAASSPEGGQSPGLGLWAVLAAAAWAGVALARRRRA